MANFVNLTSSHFGESESESVYRQRPVTGQAANPIELSDDEEYQSNTIILSDSSDVEINNEEEEEEEQEEEEEEVTFLDEEEELEEFWSRITITKMMTIKEFIYRVANPYSINQYLMSNGVFYNHLRVILCNGVSGSQMYLDSSNPNRIRWRCNGIVDQVTGNRCCNGRTKSYRVDSFFSGRRAATEDVMLVLYFWAIRIRRSEIVKMTQLDRKTVSKIISDWYQMIQEDLEDDD
ncbi:hypothetical protein BD770DRAFT_450072 [Pilaira anomala]|nr:hypothetical protein BD770DRAFT_450072 [Pilaira anomala]